MRKFISVLVLCLLAAGCAHEAGDNSCLKRAAAAEIAVTKSYETTTNLYVSGLISKSEAKNALLATDSANAAVDHAGDLCLIDKPSAEDYLATAGQFLLQASQIRGEK